LGDFDTIFVADGREKRKIFCVALLAKQRCIEKSLTKNRFQV